MMFRGKTKRRCRTRKGQHLIIEELIIFAIGLSIALGFLSTFTFLSKESKSEAVKESLSLVSSYFRLKAIETVNLDGEGSVVAPIPSNVGDQPFQATMGEHGITTVAANSYTHLTRLHGVEYSHTFSGQVESDFELISFNKLNNSIILGGY